GLRCAISRLDPAFGGARRDRDVEAQRAATGENHRPLDHILKLTDVAGPRISAKRLEMRTADERRRNAHSRRRYFDEMRRELREFFAWLPERWQLNGKDTEPVIQFLPEPALRDFLR